MMLRLLAVFCAATIALKAAGPAVPLRSDPDSVSLRLPEVGECRLTVLTPSVLELTRVSAREAEAGPESQEDLRATVGGQEAELKAMGWKRRVLYAPLGRKDLRILTSTFFQLAAPLDPAASPRVEVRARAESTARPPFSASAVAAPLRLSPAIHVNQEGYVPALPKHAFIGSYLGDTGELEISAAAGFTLVDARTGATVFRGPLQRRRDFGYRTEPRPYQEVLEADFSAFATPGEYRLAVPGLGASLPFLIDDGIAFAFARTYALGLYGQRCGLAEGPPFTRFAHAACHTAPAQIPSPASDPQFAFTWATIARYAAEPSADGPPSTAPRLTSEAAQLYPFVRRGAIDVSGGHHDAGDYSKYTINSAALIHYLVFTADAVRGAGQLDNLGLPESGDGIPDLIQEAKWEADYLAKLQDDDGGFFFLVYPKTREYESDAPPERGDAQVVWPKNTAATAAATAALAQCASSPGFKRHYPAAAAGYLRQARLGWAFLTRAIARHGEDGAYQKITFYGDHYGDRDEMAWAAAELYAATGEEVYRRALFSRLLNPADPATFRWGWWRMSESWGNAIRSYAFAARTGRLPAAALDPRYLRICEGQIIAAADDALVWSEKSAYATPFPLATKAVRAAGWYFSLDQASDIAVACQIEPKAAYLEALTGAMNYEAGGNPVNVTLLTGLGVRRQREVVDQFAQNDRRVLPPSGIPLGNLQAGFSFLPAYGAALRTLSHPADDAASGAYPIYDRWSDAYNVTTEFIAVNQARALLACACLAAQSGTEASRWVRLEGKIAVPAGAVAIGAPVTLRLTVPGRDLAGARVVWEGRDQQPAFGPGAVFTPRRGGEHWVEAEAEWPDGQRAVAVGSFRADSAVESWLDGALPPDAAPAASGGDAWDWVKAAPPAPGGGRAHRSSLAPGLHEHWFTSAADPLALGEGDALFAWVYLDPVHPPAEIMLAWNDGSSWEHRAYWGANTITYGRDGGQGRWHAGALPVAGRWVRLSVPARAVGLEHARVAGMGFSLVGGAADWARAGRAAASP